MLVDAEPRTNALTNMLALTAGNKPGVERLDTGVYLIGSFNLDSMLDKVVETWPDLEKINSFGVCDDYKQVIKQCPTLADKKRKFVMSVTPVEKSKQHPEGGWRWHKWGPYIGDKKPTTEYLYDEPEIEKVFCYKIVEVK